MPSAVVFLGHFNPLTNSHANIISNLREKYRVYVFPVVFLSDNKEVNTRSFPFPYAIRRKMVESVFDDDKTVKVLPDYYFNSPYVKYLPQLVSPLSRRFKNQIIKGIPEERFVSYTGDLSERIMLLIHGFHPLKAKRMQISSSNVKEMLYSSVLDSNSTATTDGLAWQRYVPPEVAGIIKENWSTVERFAASQDETINVFGMKIPKRGFL